MKRNVVLSAVFLLSAQLSVPTLAGECVNYSCQQSTINSITISRNGHVNIALSDALTSLKCNMASQTVQLTKQENPNFREQFTALLSSQKTKQPVNLSFDKSGQACVIDGVTVTN